MRNRAASTSAGETPIQGDADRGAEPEHSGIPPPPSPRPAPGLLDQRVDVWALLRLRGSRNSHRVSLDQVHRAIITSTMLGVKVNRGDPTALHAQVAAEIRRAIADGEAKPGERLPPARDLAAVIGVNTNTVLRALRGLRDEGLLEFRRGRGITVAGTPERGAVLTRARELVRFARQQGYERKELIRIIERVG